MLDHWPEGLGAREQGVPKGFRLVVVLDHLGHATLDVEDAGGTGDLGLDLIGDTQSVGLGRILALEDSLVVLSHVCGGRGGGEEARRSQG